MLKNWRLNVPTHSTDSFSAAAEAVLDRCVKTSNEHDQNKRMDWAYFDYEFLDDVCVEPSKESLIEWRPKFSAKDHPLVQMVSLFEYIKLANPLLPVRVIANYKSY